MWMYLCGGSSGYVHPDNVDPNNMTLVLIKSILGQYGYSPGDLIYVRDPTKKSSGWFTTSILEL
jgi:hypothetical protein